VLFFLRRIGRIHSRSATMNGRSPDVPGQSSYWHHTTRYAGKSSLLVATYASMVPLSWVFQEPSPTAVGLDPSTTLSLFEHLFDVFLELLRYFHEVFEMLFVPGSLGRSPWSNISGAPRASSSFRSSLMALRLRMRRLAHATSIVRGL
jgi:hypothetical protein